MNGCEGRRVVIIGYGVVVFCGLGREVFWSGLLGLGVIGGIKTVIVDWDLSLWFASFKEFWWVDRF